MIPLSVFRNGGPFGPVCSPCSCAPTPLVLLEMIASTTTDRYPPGLRQEFRKHSQVRRQHGTTPETRSYERSCPSSSPADWGWVPLNYATRLRLDLSKGSALSVFCWSLSAVSQGSASVFETIDLLLYLPCCHIIGLCKSLG